MTQTTNIGSIQKIEVALERDITIGAPNEKNEVVVNNRIAWDVINFTAGSASISEPEEIGIQGLIYKTKLGWKIPKAGPENYANAYKYRNKKVILKVTDGNGTVHLIGEPGRPVMIKTEKIIPAKPSGYNGYEMTVETRNTHPAYFVA